MISRKHDALRKGGRVSVWTGNFVSEEELDDYLNLRRAFEKDFGFEINERDMPETKVEDQSVTISKLVDGFSWADTYSEAVVNLAKVRGVERATTMIIFLNFEYEPDRTKPNPAAPLSFLGTVDFESES